jgi:hypothetical protein
MVGGGLGAAVNGGNVADGIGEGMEAGMISGAVGGGLAQIPIHTGNTGLLQTPLPNIAGTYVATIAMGGNRSEAQASARYSFMQGAMTNAIGLAYDKATGFKNGPTSHSAAQDKAFLMTRALDIPVIGTLFSIAGIGHLAVTNGQTSKELHPQGQWPNQTGGIGLYPENSPDNSYYKYGNRFGTSYQPLTTNYSAINAPTDTSRYDLFVHNSNTAIYNLPGVR